LNLRPLGYEYYDARLRRSGQSLAAVVTSEARGFPGSRGPPRLPHPVPFHRVRLQIDLRNRHLICGSPQFQVPAIGAADRPVLAAGASVGTLPAQLVIAAGVAQVSAAALISPVIQLAEVVAANERRFKVSYPWSDASRAVAARFDFVSRAGEIAARDPQPAMLLVTGAEDDSR
jgi:hypothetical protein